MAIKSVSIRIEEEMLEKIGYVADYEGRSVNSHVPVMLRENIRAFEQEHGPIDGSIGPDENVKPTRKAYGSAVIERKIPAQKSRFRCSRTESGLINYLISENQRLAHAPLTAAT